MLQQNEYNHFNYALFGSGEEHLSNTPATANSEAAASADEVSLACQKVGRFLYDFARLEQEINERIVDILQPQGSAADVISHSLDCVTMQIIAGAITRLRR